jgi:hypothetical protein
LLPVVALARRNRSTGRVGPAQSQRNFGRFNNLNRHPGRSRHACSGFSRQSLSKRATCREKNMASKVGPWFSNTWWGKRHFKINVSLVIALLLFLWWKSFF